MSPYYQDEFVTLYHGDCRDVLRSGVLPHPTLVLTDPPFGISAADITRNGGSTLRQNFFADDDVAVAVEMLSLLPPCPWSLFAFCGHTQFGPIEAFCRAKGRKTGPFAWVKSAPAPSVRMSSWRSSLELAVWAYLPGEFHWHNQETAINWRHCGAYQHGHRDDKVAHPTQKPLELLTPAILQLTTMDAPTDIVLDPFAGSGSSLVAAKALGRRAWGIEREERYCEIAAQRLSQSVLDLGGAA